MRRSDMVARILMNITHGFQARMLLRTRIAEDLVAAGCEIVVVSPNADEEYFRREFSRPGFTLVKMPRRYSKPEKAVVTTRQYFLMNPSLGATFNFKRERYREYYPFRYWVTRAGNVVLGNVPPLRRAYLAAERWLFDGSEFDSILEQHQPALVVAGTPGFNVYDAHLLRACRRCKVPSVTVMLSWDNLTSKGYMGAQPDNLLVWSKLMRTEASQYHDFTGPVIEVGAAQFDVYTQSTRDQRRATFRRQHGIPPDAGVIVWGTINPVLYPGQLDLLKRFISDSFARGPSNRHLWIRIHPQSVFGRFEEMRPAYEALRTERIHVDLPPVTSTELPWDLPKQDMFHLAELLSAADVVVVPGSTLTIDAACSDTPVINLATERAAERVILYTHYQKLLEADGIWVVRTFDELEAAIERYLVEPEMHRDGRRRIVDQQLGQFYGNSGGRTAAVLLAIARRESIPTGLPAGRGVRASG